MTQPDLQNQNTPALRSTGSQDVPHWHAMPGGDVLHSLGSAATGLSAGEAATRLERSGPNELPRKPRESPWLMLARQFFGPLILTLVAAAAVSAFMGEVVEAVAIIVIVVLAGIVGFIQEYQAERALEALQRLAAPVATVRRDGAETMVASREIVPGDVIVLKTGDAVPADARLLEAPNLEVDESTLTGESLAAVKTTDLLPGGQRAVGDRTNMVYAGTSVVRGRGTAVVTGTGGGTEFGKIAALLQSTGESRTPLQVVLDRLGRTLGFVALVLAVLMSILGVLRGYPLLEMFIWGVAIAVAVIPEALPAVVTITLAIGVRRMAARNALIRRLPAVETLGATSVICSDKTGTLTQNEMTVRRVLCDERELQVSGAGFDPGGSFHHGSVTVHPATDPVLRHMLMVGALCNDAGLKRNGEGAWEVLGDPTEAALLVAAVKGGIDPAVLNTALPRVAEVPFTSERKCMSTLHEEGDALLVCVKGAPEVILNLCSAELLPAGERALAKERADHLREQAQRMAAAALRVLGLAYARVPRGTDPGAAEANLIFAGMVGIQDPPRPEVFTAIRTCAQAGIRPVMITGDHLVTAVSVARELGITRDGAEALTGDDLERITDEELAGRIASVDVFARISPEHKLRIVNAFLANGHVVAMTGDGVNDAPSLKRADIGVAMGITGTDVSKESADMILTDDNFATIVEAVREGRSIYQNIRKYLVFLLGGNFGTVLALVTALLAGLPLPLVAVQVLFINFVMDGLIAIALGVEPPEAGIMRRAPRGRDEGMLNGEALVTIGVVGAIIGLLPLGIYAAALGEGVSGPYAMTLFFWGLIAARLMNGLNCRSLVESSLIPRGAGGGNTALMVSMLVTVGLTMMAIYVAPLQEVFATVPLRLEDLGMVLGASVLVVVAGEAVKAVRRGRRRAHALHGPPSAA